MSKASATTNYDVEYKNLAGKNEKSLLEKDGFLWQYFLRFFSFR